MATYRGFTDAASGLKIEVEGTSSSPESYLSLLLTDIRSIVSSLASEVKGMPDDARPDEMEVSFGLRALSSGGFAVVFDQGSANFKVNVKWGGEGAGGLGAMMPKPKGPGI
jgi:hypothetical protein